MRRELEISGRDGGLSDSVGLLHTGRIPVQELKDEEYWFKLAEYWSRTQLGTGTFPK